MKNKETIEWIPVSRELPDAELAVLIHSGDGDISMACWDGADWWSYGEEGVSNISMAGIRVLHWATVEGPL